MPLSMFTRREDHPHPNAVQAIADEAVPRPSFYILVLLSTAIASYGLLANSTAVVIGAMLIAPLMGPIYGIALGLIRDDRRLFLNASVSEGLGIVLAVGLAVAIGALPLRPDFGAEILGRTRPNLYDLLVAIVAGVAGGYARVSERVSPTLPGVAIATALVPPLAACGLCLADARWHAAFGAFVLFATNLLAIEIAAGAVFVFAGLAVRPATEGFPAATLLRRFTIPVLLLIPIAAFLLSTLIALVRDDRLSKNLRAILSADMHAVLGASVTDVQHEQLGDELRVVAIVLTPQPIAPALVATTESDLRERVAPGIHLIVRSLLSRDADRTGQVFLDDKLREHLRTAHEQESFVATISGTLQKALERIAGAELVDVQRERRDSPRVTATIRGPVVIDPLQVSLMQQAATEATGMPIQLVVHSVVTKEANAQQYLDEDEQTTFHQQISDAVTQVLRRSAPDIEVLSVRTMAGDTVDVQATVVGGHGLDGSTADAFNRALTEAAGKPVQLTLRILTAKTVVVPGTAGRDRVRAGGRRPSTGG